MAVKEAFNNTAVTNVKSNKAAKVTAIVALCCLERPHLQNNLFQVRS
jgi:hypothetical protein